MQSVADHRQKNTPFLKPWFKIIKVMNNIKIITTWLRDENFIFIIKKMMVFKEFSNLYVHNQDRLFDMQKFHEIHY